MNPSKRWSLDFRSVKVLRKPATWTTIPMSVQKLMGIVLYGV